MGLDPTTIGRYVVLGTLGQGAMGVVYLGEDPVLKRGVALKVVHSGQAQGREQALRRFHREAEISAKLNHPNVITVFDVGEEEGVGPFLAMEFIEGETLDALLRRGPLPPQRILEILIQAASALEAAHALAIVHRDVKPSNLMVAGDGRVKLMDFGIAKEEDQANTTEALLCTPGYAAPEMLDGAKASAATDRWAFAVSAYECLQGKGPFDGENISVVLYNVAHGSPAFPADLDPAVVAVFKKALAKAPGDRYQDLPSFLEDLLTAMPLEEAVRRRFRNHLRSASAVKAEAPSAVPVQVPERPHRVKPILWTAGSLVGITLAFYGWWAGYLLPRHLKVDSSPGGAWVFADGSLVARTPTEDLQVPRRTKVIRFELDRHRPVIIKLTDDTRELSARLSPRYLLLDLDSRPSGATIYVNDRNLGKTPQKGVRIPNEIHGTPVMVSKDGYEPFAASVNEGNLPPTLIVLRPRGGER
jgi:serine/threonine-protein kinase